MDPQCQGFTNGQLRAHDINFIIGVDFVIVGGIGECQWQQTLFFEVGFMLKKC